MKTAENYQTYLDIRLNHILGHSANGEENYSKPSIKKSWETTPEGHWLWNATSISLHPLYNVMFHNTCIQKNPLFLKLSYKDHFGQVHSIFKKQ